MSASLRQPYGAHSVYRRSCDSRWFAAIEVGRDDNNTRRRVTVSAATESAVRLRLDQRVAELSRSGEHVSGRQPRSPRRLPTQRRGQRLRGLPVEPLLRQIELRGGDYEVGVLHGTTDKRQLERARARGSLSYWKADDLATRLLGLTLWDLWPAEVLDCVL